LSLGKRAPFLAVAQASKWLNDFFQQPAPGTLCACIQVPIEHERNG
jgi:hypothetical protein